jgi:hypothetical protein
VLSSDTEVSPSNPGWLALIPIITISLSFQHFGKFGERDELERSRGRTEKTWESEIAVVGRDLISQFSYSIPFSKPSSELIYSHICLQGFWPIPAQTVEH